MSEEARKNLLQSKSIPIKYNDAPSMELGTGYLNHPIRQPLSLEGAQYKARQFVPAELDLEAKSPYREL